MIEREILDPKLAVALDEVDAVLRRHAIAGAITLASSTHAAFRLTFPTWSAVQIVGDGLHIRSSSERDGKEHLAASMHLLLSLRDLALLQAQNLGDIGSAALAVLEAEGVEIEHEAFGGDADKEN